MEPEGFGVGFFEDGGEVGVNLAVVGDGAGFNVEAFVACAVQVAKEAKSGEVNC